MKKLFNDSFENWIFDLDNTIYDIKAGLFVKISERITEYIMTMLSFTREEANLVRSNMYKKYGLTLTGLMREYEIDPDEYLDFIHDVTHPELKYEKQLKLSLKNLSGRKFIYTNASQDHAKNILSAMGIEAEFEKILDIKATQYVPKPDPKSYEIMLKSFGIFSNQIENSIFIEDTAKNLKPAKLLGLKTVWMENERNLEDYKENAKYVDYKYSDLKSFFSNISTRN
jgi:putative hydrolase of the HAD superfamily